MTISSKALRLTRQMVSLVVFLVVCVLCLCGGVALAGTGWEVTSATFPTNLAPSGGTGTLGINVYNVGATPSKGTVTVTDELPAGVVATQAGDLQNGFGGSFNEFGLWDCTGNGPGAAPGVEGASVVTCVNDPFALPSLPIPEEHGKAISEEGSGTIENLGVGVRVETANQGTLTNRVTVAGGGAAAPASTSAPVTIDPSPASSFGFQGSSGWFSSADGTVDTQAGSHPYEFTYTFNLNTRFRPLVSPTLEPVGGEARDLTVNAPPGFVGNPTGVPECSRQNFEEEACSPSTQVGLDEAGVLGGQPIPAHLSFPVYNLVPPPGMPAQFGFTLFSDSIYLDTGVRSGGDYGITVHVNNLVQERIMDNSITFWGEPSDPSHDEDRSSKSGDNGNCLQGCASGAPRVPFLTTPTSCGGPQTFSETLNTWETTGFGASSYKTRDSSGVETGFTGCNHLGFDPTISVAPDTSRADTPAGLTVDVRVPQEGLVTTGALATSNIKNTVVTLPVGMVINPGQAAGLQSCPAGRPARPERYGDALTTPEERERGEEDNGAAYCPNSSKVGTVEIETPLLKHSLKGDVYVLQSNPPNLRLLVAAEGEGVFLKLVGNVSLCESAGEVLDGKTCEAVGQLITRFSETPELPFTDFKLAFSGGAQAALDTPTQCGEHTTRSDFTPWSTRTVADAFPSSNFAISSGPGGSACPSGTLPFSPSLIAGSTTDQAGGFTSFSLLLQRGDGQQRIEKLSFKAPQGLAGMISVVPVCPEPQASQGACSAVSQIGHATVASGPGPYPLTIPQPGDPESPIYLTGPYQGAPFGLTIVTHVLAGPFDLGTIITRAKIEVDPHTAQITVTTDPLPQVIDGVPTDLRLVDSVIDRPGFMFNPTNCDASSFAGTAWGAPPPGTNGPGASAAIGSHFQVGSCQSLKFDPNFKVSTSGKTSKANGASLDAKVIYPTGALPANQATSQANIAKVRVELPKQLPSRLTTLQKACTAAQFNANPAGCPSASVIGHASAITPVLPVALVGPAYFVSNGGEAFPNLIMVLQGDGVRIDLVSDTFISKAGITSSTFKQLPDAPVTSFDLTLPQGKYSALAANGNLCTSKLTMPSEFTGQNGAVFKQSTKITVTGCAKTRILTRAQKLAKALKACHKVRSRARRRACAARAHRRYGPHRKSGSSRKG
jgi:hypothetical protein